MARWASRGVGGPDPGVGTENEVRRAMEAISLVFDLLNGVLSLAELVSHIHQEGFSVLPPPGPEPPIGREPVCDGPLDAMVT